MLFGDVWAVNATAVAFLGLSVVILTGVLTWDDILKEKSAWDTLVWFGVLIMMATYLNKLGLIAWFSGQIETVIGGMGVGWVGAVVILTLVYLYAHYFFASTTAHITAMFGAFYGVGMTAKLSWLLGGFLFIGAMVHLALDELYSVNVLGLRLKKSAGTALKFFESKKPLRYIILYIIVLLLFLYAPDHQPALNSVRVLIQAWIQKFAPHAM